LLDIPTFKLYRSSVKEAVQERYKRYKSGTDVTTRAAGEGLLTLHIPSTRTCKGDKGPPPAHPLSAGRMATPRTRLEVGLYVSVLFPSGLPQLDLPYLGRLE